MLIMSKCQESVQLIGQPINCFTSKCNSYQRGCLCHGVHSQALNVQMHHSTVDSTLFFSYWFAHTTISCHTQAQMRMCIRVSLKCTFFSIGGVRHCWYGVPVGGRSQRCCGGGHDGWRGDDPGSCQWKYHRCHGHQGWPDGQQWDGPGPEPV